MKMLQRDIDNGELDGLGGYFSSNSNILSSSFNSNSLEDFSTFPQAISFDEMMSRTINTSNTTNNNNTGGVTISGNTFNVRKDLDINEIAFRLFELMSDQNANYGGV